MIRTQIQLPKEEYEQLREIAARQRRSMADCIREGIRWFLRRTQTESGDLSAVAGKFRPIPTDDLKPQDRWHAQAIAESKKRGSPS